MYAYMSVHQLILDVGESSSKLMNWSLANCHVGETTVIRAHAIFLLFTSNSITISLTFNFPTSEQKKSILQALVGILILLIAMDIIMRNIAMARLNVQHVRSYKRNYCLINIGM